MAPPLSNPYASQGKPWQFNGEAPKARAQYSNACVLQKQRRDRQKKLFQFLNDVGAQARHIGLVQEIAETSAWSAEYQSRINALLHQIGVLAVLRVKPKEYRSFAMILPTMTEPPSRAAASRLRATEPLKNIRTQNEG